MNRTCRGVALAVVVLTCSSPAFAQQRPLLTEDPETIGAGRVLIEGGLDASHNYQNPVSGLKGDLLSVPTLGLSFGLSSIAELQIDGTLFNRLNVTSRNPNAPLASFLTFSGSTTTDFTDAVIATKIRMLSESASRPALGVRFATKLPNASDERGIDLNTTDFSAYLIAAKTVESVRVVANIGVGVLSDPTNGHRQNDVLLYALSFARAMTQQAEIVGEVIGRQSTRSGEPFPGTESRGMLKLGGRFTTGSVRFDTAVFFGTTTLDPTIGFTVGFTYVFNAFTIP
jgi:hypothetical protein